jgi:hypothetical protein
MLVFASFGLPSLTSITLELVEGFSDAGYADSIELKRTRGMSRQKDKTACAVDIGTYVRYTRP